MDDLSTQDDIPYKAHRDGTLIELPYGDGEAMAKIRMANLTPRALADVRAGLDAHL